jgi:hypothetical protein
MQLDVGSLSVVTAFVTALLGTAHAPKSLTHAILFAESFAEKPRDLCNRSQSLPAKNPRQPMEQCYGHAP